MLEVALQRLVNVDGVGHDGSERWIHEYQAIIDDISAQIEAQFRDPVPPELTDRDRKNLEQLLLTQISNFKTRQKRKDFTREQLMQKLQDSPLLPFASHLVKPLVAGAYNNNLLITDEELVGLGCSYDDAIDQIESPFRLYTEAEAKSLYKPGRLTWIQSTDERKAPVFISQSALKYNRDFKNDGIGYIRVLAINLT